MADADLRFLKTLELRLLRCTISPPPSTQPPPPPSPSPSPLLSSVAAAVSSIESGDFAAALASNAARRIFRPPPSWRPDDSADSAAEFFAAVEDGVDAFVRGGVAAEAWLGVLGDEEDDGERSGRLLLVLCVGVSALLAFNQANFTGPPSEFCAVPNLFLDVEGGKTSGCGGKEWELWAQKQLMATGCLLLGKLSMLQYLVLAKTLLMKMKDLCCEMDCFDGLRTVSWWLCRALFLHQRILDEASSSLFNLMQVCMGEMADHFGRSESVNIYLSSEVSRQEINQVVTLANLEIAIVEHAYARVDSARKFLTVAEEACELKISVTGVHGFRRADQTIAHPQMVLVTSSGENDKNVTSTEKFEPHASTSGLCDNLKVSNSAEQINECDVLLAPRLLVDGENSSGPREVILDGHHQVVVLAHCLLLKEGARVDDLQRWKMAPYIEAVDAQAFSHFMIKCFCTLLRIRWEATRSKTKERAVIMMDKLVENILRSGPSAKERAWFSYGVYVPSVPALRKEYGELLVSCGMIGEALKIFEDLELWDNLIYCYALLEKKSAAVEVIKSRLIDFPNDPRLWCSLGDVTNEDSCYEKALEVSNGRSARAKRALARNAYNRGDYERSMNLWESAMAVNSLYSDGWFALGAAAMKARNVDKALGAFTSAVQLDPENGESWNNIACLHKMKKKNNESFIAFKEALKFRRKTWQMWENYGEVALDIGNYGQAVLALTKVLELTDNKRIDVELLERLIIEMERKLASIECSQFSESECGNDAGESNSDSSVSTSMRNLRLSEITNERESQMLLESIGKVLQQIVRSGKGENIWGLYARWHKMKGDNVMCSEALLKEVRSYQGSDLWHNGEKFGKFARASLHLCQVYMVIGSSTGSCRELFQAEMHLRNTLKQGVRFIETEEYKDLQSCYDEIKKLLESTDQTEKHA